MGASLLSKTTMAINALFPANTYRANAGTGSAQNGGADSTFATALAALTRDVEQARSASAEQAIATSSRASNTAATTAGSQTASTHVGLSGDAQADAAGAADGITITMQPIAG
jgi:hypothetical protein